MKLNTKKKKEPTLSQLDFVLPRITQRQSGQDLDNLA